MEYLRKGLLEPKPLLSFFLSFCLSFFLLFFSFQGLLDELLVHPGHN